MSEAVDEDTPLLSSGLVDSLSLAALLEVLHAHFGAAIDPSEIGVDNFDTPRQIERVIRSAV